MLSMINIAEATEVLKPLMIFIVGIVIYSVFIFHFYRFLARKDIIKFNLEKYNTTSFAFLKKIFSSIIYVFKYIVVVPILIFFWFGILTLLLTFLSKNSDVSQILLIAMAMIATIRITSYYNEALSTDLAKMLPFALLGVYIVDVTFFKTVQSLGILTQIPEQINMLIYYFAFVVALEFILRLIHGILGIFVRKTE